jgi:pre-mRNA-splicing factor CWC22
LHFTAGTDVFKADPKFLENEKKYAEIKEEILGGDSDDESGSEADSDSEDEDADGKLESNDKPGINLIYCSASVAPELEGIQDMTETDLIDLRRTIYLTLMNSLGFEEAVHKLMNIAIPEGKEVRLV